jgi:hypothetical protein
METVRPSLRRELGWAVLAGLEAGVVAGVVMLLWYAVTSAMANRSPWDVPTVLAEVFLPPGRVSQRWATLAAAGAAVPVAGGGLIGVLFGIAARFVRASRHMILLGLLFGLSWYYAWRALAAQRIGAGAAAIVSSWKVVAGYLLFGLLLALYPRLLRGVRAGFPAEG